MIFVLESHHLVCYFIGLIRRVGLDEDGRGGWIGMGMLVSYRIGLVWLAWIRGAGRLRLRVCG